METPDVIQYIKECNNLEAQENHNDNLENTPTPTHDTNNIQKEIIKKTKELEKLLIGSL